MNYYNEFDPNAAAWLRQLIAEGLIPAGDVDQRSITDVLPTELSGYTQCHFFAGIGGWSLALGLAGWPTDRPVWTGSCPCQPFSVAGKGKGSDDERHLWPAFFNLIRECRPQHVFGEQVESAIAHGWLDGIRSDLEGEGYACGDATLGAHSVGSPHQRQRLYWVADTGCAVRGPRNATGCSDGSRNYAATGRAESPDEVAPCCDTGRMANSQCPRLEGHGWHGDHGHKPRWDGTEPIGPTAASGTTGGVGDATMQQRCRSRKSGEIDGRTSEVGGSGARISRVANPALHPGQSSESWATYGPVSEGDGESIASSWMADTCRAGIRRRISGKDVAEEGEGEGQRKEWEWIRSDAGDVMRRLGESDLSECGSCQPESCGERPVGQGDSGAAHPGLPDGDKRMGDSQGRGCGIIGDEAQPRRGGYPDGASLNPWADSIWIPCRDGKHRRIPAQSVLQSVADGLSPGMGDRGLPGYSEDEAGAICQSVHGFPLCPKIPHRPQILKGAGNAIVPQVAAAFITAFLEVTSLDKIVPQEYKTPE